MVNIITFSGFVYLGLSYLPVPLEENSVSYISWKHSVSCFFLAYSQKATKKTDKPRPEEKDDLDITEMSNEDLQEQLVKYGLNPGPIVGRSSGISNTDLFNIFPNKPQFCVF